MSIQDRTTATRRAVVATGTKLVYATPLLAASFALSAEKTAAISGGSEGGTRTCLDVPAIIPWTDTGIDLSTGQAFGITGAGRIRIAGSAPGKNPDGSTFGDPVDPRCETGLVPDFVTHDASCWSLIGRIGNGAPFPVGYGTNLTATVGERLFLGVNDNVFDDNTGSFQECVTR